MPFKVVSIDRQREKDANNQDVTVEHYFSIYPQDSGDCLFEYRLGEQVKISKELETLGYGLCVFDTLENAAAFLNLIRAGKDHAIFECDATGTDRSWWGLHNGALNVMFNLDMLKKMWRDSVSWRSSNKVKDWPAGTQMADSVTLLRRVATINAHQS